VDGEGDPVAGADVQMAGARDGTLHGTNTTDEQGRIRLPGIKERNVLLTIRHPTHGARTRVPVTLPADPEEEFIFVLEPQHEVRVHATHGGAPTPGVSLQLLTAETMYFDVPRLSDGEGLVRWNEVPSGDYQLRVEQAGYWIDHSPFTVGDSDADVYIELRKLGRFELHASNAEGLPVNGVHVDLRHLDLGIDVQELAAAGRLGLPDAGMVTRGRGRLESENLPEGRYRWSVALPDGDSLSGVVLVEGGELARATAQLP